MIRRCAALFLFIAYCAGLAQADLVLGTSGTLNATSGTTTGVLTLTVENTTSVGEFLTGWQFALQVVPSSTATGTVSFSSAALPSGTSYLLDGMNDGLSSTISTTDTTNDTLFAFDFQNPTLSGVQVAATGSSLLEIEFAVSPDALGTFDLVAYQQPGSRTEWADGNAAAGAFTNVPLNSSLGVAGKPISFGSLLVSVPEPSAFLFLSGIAILGVGWRYLVSFLNVR